MTALALDLLPLKMKGTIHIFPIKYSIVPRQCCYVCITSGISSMFYWTFLQLYSCKY